ncbi:uncharacterized protein LOC127283880 [Leptopilina boulardi]|uniref:uncharacterized protein LOC127283880 n=1 Tax=Leptopilina boulardi TaxID=63433 RepID=UPI0021F5B0B0|nr:uncharacterized protein LOC127283880 [Leptopilina boulardi]
MIYLLNFIYLQKIMIDGGFAKIQLNREWNIGTADFEFTLNSSSKITCIPLTLNGEVVKREITLVNFGDLANSYGFIKIQGYLRSQFQKIDKFKEDICDFLLASITDREYCLEVRVQNISDFENLKKYKRGNSLEISGYMRTRRGNKSYLSVSSEKHILQINLEKMALSKIISGNKSIQKRKAEDDNEISKKLNKTI